MKTPNSSDHVLSMLDKTELKVLEAALLTSFKEVIQQAYLKGNTLSIRMVMIKEKNATKKTVLERIIFRTMYRLRSLLNRPLLLLKKACKTLLNRLINMIRQTQTSNAVGKTMQLIHSLNYNKAKYRYIITQE